MATSEDIAVFIALGATAFRQKVLSLDPDFFKITENQVIYKDFCQNLAYIWMNNHRVDGPISMENWPGAGGNNGNIIN